MKRRVFIVSSTESLDVAHALQMELDNWAETTIWSQAVFTPSSTALDDLISAAGEYDSGIFVFSFEDVVRIRDQEYRTTRDNVVFELGLFIGSIGKERTFLVVPRTQQNFHLPTDLLGLTYLTFDPNRSDRNLQAALGPACTRIRETIEKTGTSSNSFKTSQEELASLLGVMRRIVELHQTAYSQVGIRDWSVTHSIDEQGTGHLHEEFTITTEGQPVYFYLIESNYLEREYESTFSMAARNEEVPLSLVKLRQTPSIVSHAIVLDPPVTKERPQRITIDCTRKFIWKDLVDRGEDQGVLRVTNKTNLLHFEFIAPRNRTWKGFNPTPQIGDVTIGPAKITWNISEPETGRFSFKLFLS